MEDQCLSVASCEAVQFSAPTETAHHYTTDPKKFIQDIALKHRRRIGQYWIPRDRIWILYDPTMTTKWRDDSTASRFQEFLKRRHEEEKVQARERRHASAARRKELLETSCRLGHFGILVERIADLFAAGLLNELRVAHQIMSRELLENELEGWDFIEDNNQPSSLGGLFAKWAPTPGGMHDKALGMASLVREKLLEKLREDKNRSLAEKILGSSGHHIQAPLHLEHLSLQRDVLTKLRKLAGVPEHHIGAGTLKGGVDYDRMASRCRMIFGEKLFRRYDGDNYDRYLLHAAKAMLLKKIRKSEEGKNPKVAVGALAPHEVMLRAVQADATKSLFHKVEAGLQWQALLDSCAQPRGKNNSIVKRLIIPMCDVSGSMCCHCEDGSNGTATCMDVACALSLLLADSLPKDHVFYGKILTFSANPHFVDLVPKTKGDLTIKEIEEATSLDDVAALLPDLSERVSKLRGSDCGFDTNFFRAMKCICDIALQNKMTACDLQGLELVVFSDMEFNEAQYGEDFNQKTMMEKIRMLFIHRFGSGISANPPKIVFWNLRASTSGSGVVKDKMEDGVALFSGFSSGLLRKYLTWDLSSNSEENQAKSDMNPMKAMLACLTDPLYQTLKLEKDLDEWEVLVSEEEIMRRAELVHGENNEPVYKSNSSALVAFFFEAVPDIGVDGLEDLMDAAFKENPKIALKLLFNLGTVRKNTAGKADRQNFQLGLMWLWRNWPKTYLLNVTAIAKFASLKELLNSAMFILYEDKSERDPDDYALFSLMGQKEALIQHLRRKQYRQNAARRMSKKERRLELWSDFASCEGKTLFGNLRIEVEWEKVREKLGDLTELKFKRIQNRYFEYNADLIEILWEMKDRHAEARVTKLARRRRRSKTKKLAKKRMCKERCYMPLYDD
ncbi:hypothetical protein ACHAW6_012104 [Cyclotella cf. meneghiniana]